MPFSIPVTAIISMWLNSVSFSELIGKPVPAILTSAGTVVFGFIGSFIGYKIAAELQKAGKLKPYGDSNNV